MKPWLALCWGNPSRGDDAIGPILADWLEALQSPAVEVITDYQLQIEYAADLQNRQQVLFIDASVSTTAPFTVENLKACKDHSISSHALSPQALLQVYHQVYSKPAPAAHLLSVRGYAFELGQPVSAQAKENLRAAKDWLHNHLSNISSY